MPASGPYILQVINNPTLTGGSVNHYVPGPISANTPGIPGDYSTDPATGRRIDYTGDGINHSWGYNELVVYPPSSQQ